MQSSSIITRFLPKSKAENIMNLRKYTDMMSQIDEFCDFVEIEVGCESLTDLTATKAMEFADEEGIFDAWAISKNVPNGIQIILCGMGEKDKVSKLLQGLDTILGITSISSGITASIEVMDRLIQEGNTVDFVGYFSLWMDGDMTDEEYAEKAGLIGALDTGWDLELKVNSSRGDIDTLDEMRIEYEDLSRLNGVLPLFKGVGAKAITLHLEIKLSTL
jgi:hypothetical protein